MTEQAENTVELERDDTSAEGTQQSTSRPTQEEMPFAIVHGKAYTQLPKDLYIPPEALEVAMPDRTPRRGTDGSLAAGTAVTLK